MRGFNHNDITIFVADEKELLIYKALYPEYNFVIGEKGISNIRNFIMNYYDKDEYVVSLDDDIESLWPRQADQDYKDLFIRGETELKEKGLTLWGVNSTKNKLWMAQQKEVSTNLKFCIGQCFGFVNKKLMVNAETATKEDYEFTILNYINYGGVVRFNRVAPKTKMYQAGGIGNKKQRAEQNEIATQYIWRTYPDYCCIVRGGDGYAELRLRHSHKFTETGFS
jgi:hypothetical protein